MKHFYLLLALLWLASAGPSLAQIRSAAPTQPADSARQYLSNLFAPLDKSQLPTGRLLKAAVLLSRATDKIGG